MAVPPDGTEGEDCRGRVLHHLSAVGREMGALPRAAAHSLGLHETQLEALLVLLCKPDTSIGDLARELGMSSGATTALADNLERSGRVRRRTDPEDRRRVILECTAHARRQCGQAFSALHTALASVMCGYTNVELSLIDRFLSELRAVIDEQRDTRGNR